MGDNQPVYSDEHARIDGARQHARGHVPVQDLDLFGYQTRIRIAVVRSSHAQASLDGRIRARQEEGHGEDTGTLRDTSYCSMTVAGGP